MGNQVEQLFHQEAYGKEIQSSIIFFFCVRKALALYIQKLEWMDRSNVLRWLVVINPSHICFFNENILFCRASLIEWKHIQVILEKYEAASGQCVNKQKATIMFSSDTSDAIKDQIKTNAVVSLCFDQGKYLGLPSTVGRSKNSTFGPLKDRIWHKIHNWKKTYLSLAEKVMV